MTPRPRLFGSFLIEQGIISEDALLTALVEQMRRTPTPAEIVHDCRLFSVTDQLQIIEQKALTGRSYLDVVEEIGLYTETLSRTLTAERKNRRPLLGQILLESHGVTFEQLTQALDEFLQDAKVPEISSTKEKGSKTRSSSRPVGEESNPQEVIDPFLVERYLEVISKEDVEGIKDVILSMRDGKFEEQKILEQEHKLERMRVAAKFVRAQVSENCCEGLLVFFSSSRAKKESVIDLAMALRISEGLGLARASVEEESSEERIKSMDLFSAVDKWNKAV